MDFERNIVKTLVSSLKKRIPVYPLAKLLIVGEAGIPLEKFFSESPETWL